MFLRPNYRPKDGKEHAYWSLVETVRTPNGPRQRTVCYLAELNHSAQARWHKTIAVFNEQGERRQLKLFPADAEAPENDPQVARVLVDRVRFDRVRQFGNCFLGLELWQRLELDQFLAARLDPEAKEVPGSRVGALLPINRLCAPTSELGIEERWYPSTALDDLLGLPPGVINNKRLYRCLDRLRSLSAAHQPPGRNLGRTLEQIHPTHRSGSCFSGFEERVVDPAVVSSTRTSRQGAHPGGLPGLCALGHAEASAAAQELEPLPCPSAGAVFHARERRHRSAHHRWP